MTRLCAVCLLIIMLIAPLPAGAQSDPPSFRLAQQIGRGHIQSLAWHPTDDVILVSTIRGAWFYDGLLRDVGHIEDARLATFSPDGKLVAGVDTNNQITLWDGHTYAPIGTLPGHDALVTAIAWSPNGEQLATGDQLGNVVAWDVGQLREISRWQIDEIVSILRWCPDNTLLAVAGVDSALLVYNAISAQSVFDVEALSCCDSASTKDIAWLNSIVLARLESDTGKIEQWNVQSGEMITDQWSRVDPDHFISWGQPYAISPDKALLARANMGSIEVIERASEGVSYELDEPHWFLGHIIWSNDSTKLVAAGIYDELYLWEFPQAALIAENLEHARPEPMIVSDGQWQLGDPNVSGLPSWSFDSQFLAVPDHYSALSVWDGTTWNQVAVLVGPDAPVVEAAWNPANNWLMALQDCVFVGDDYTIHIWDAPTGNLIDSYAHEECPRSAAWHSVDNVLLSVSHADAQIYVWNGNRRQLGASLTIAEDDSHLPQYAPITSAFLYLNGVGWSPDGHHLVISYPGAIGDVTELYDYPGLTRTSCFGYCYFYNHGHDNLTFRGYWAADSTQWFQIFWYDDRAFQMFPSSIEGDPFRVEVAALLNTQSYKLHTMTLHGHSHPLLT